MGSRVLVVVPPLSVARDFIDYPYFCDLGGVQLAAVLRAEHEVELRDAFARPGSGLSWAGDRARLGCDVDSLLALLPTVDAAVVTYPPFCRPPHRDEVLAEVLAALRPRVDGPLLLADAYQSGQHYVEAPGDAVLAAYPEVDGWVKYEAEVTVPSLLRGDLGPRRAVRGEQAELDRLPLPAWDLVDLDARDRFAHSVVANLGRGHWAFPIDGRTLPVLTTRGCPFTCLHCSSNPDRQAGEPKTQRRLSPASLRARLTALVREHGATRLAVLDELVNVNERHFDTFLDLADELDVAFDVPNGMRADYLRRRHFARMHGRVTTVSVSAESGSQRVVTEVVGKQLELGAIETAAAEAHRAGVPLLVHWMIGLPGESAAEVNETLERALDLWDRFGATPAVQFATPLPGTQLAADTALPIVQDWGPRFQGGPTALPNALPPALLRRFMQTFEQRLAASSGPKKLIVNVTYVCNNHCTFCAVGTRTQIDGHPTRLREHLLRHRRKGVRQVDFDGGEPTLNPELVGLIVYARSLGYGRINVTTNGRMCAYPDYARKLVTSGLTTLLFSIHGADARTHAQQVGVAEAFEQSTTGIAHCVDAAPAGVELGMNITLTKGNVEQLPDVAELALSLGLRWLNIQFLTPFGRATQMVAPVIEDAAAIAMRTIDAYKDRMKLQVINLPYCFMPGYEAHLEGDRLKLSRHMVFVNNETVNLAEYLAERRVKKPVCRECPHATFCGGFYELTRVPEPEWIVSAESLHRRVDPG